jgi:hypothetical protein
MAAGFALSVTGSRDPVVWTVDMQYGVGLPKKERFYMAWQPRNIQVADTASHLFNERFESSNGKNMSKRRRDEASGNTDAYRI